MGKTVAALGRRSLVTTVVLAIWWPAVSRVEASAGAMERLRPALAEVAGKVARALKEHKKDAVAVGDFSGPGFLPSSGGAAIRKILTEELRNLGVKVTFAARAGIKGEYRAVKDRRSGGLALVIKGSLRDSEDEELLPFEARLVDEAVLVTLMGITVQPPANPRNRNNAVQGALNHPRVAVQGSRVAARAGSSYALEVLVASHSGGRYHPRTASKAAGLARVRIRRGEVFAVRLINNSSAEVAVELHLDGINMFAFSEVRDEDDRPKYSRLILAPRGSYLVKGWYRTNNWSEEFQVTRYSRSAVAELGQSTAKVGTISASFAVARKKPVLTRKDQKRDLPVLRKNGGGDMEKADEGDMKKSNNGGEDKADEGRMNKSKDGGEGNAIGRARRIPSDYTEAGDRLIGKPVAYIAIRYTK
jgi:hypothetical protein